MTGDVRAPIFPRWFRKLLVLGWQGPLGAPCSLSPQLQMLICKWSHGTVKHFLNSNYRRGVDSVALVGGERVRSIQKKHPGFMDSDPGFLWIGERKWKKIYYFKKWIQIFWRARVCWQLLCLCRPFFIFKRYLDSNSESCRSQQVRYQLSHPSPYKFKFFLGLNAI